MPNNCLNFKEQCLPFFSFPNGGKLGKFQEYKKVFCFSVQIQTSGGLSKADINRMQEEAEKFADEDKKKRDAVEVMNNIDTGLYSAKEQLNEHKDKLSAELVSEIQDKINEVEAAKAGGDVEVKVFFSMNFPRETLVVHTSTTNFLFF